MAPRAGASRRARLSGVGSPSWRLRHQADPTRRQHALARTLLEAAGFRPTPHGLRLRG
jgi:hypothetical protein